MTAASDEILPLVQLLAPFAPHIAEECWSYFGGAHTVFDSGWPAYDPALLVSDTITIAVQVNGKTRGTVHVAKDATQQVVYDAALREPNIAKFVVGEPKKIIYEPGRLLNIVM